jgi:hypothetical protein
MSFAYRKYKTIKKQNAMKTASIIPSLLFLLEILCIKLLIPGI